MTLRLWPLLLAAAVVGTGCMVPYDSSYSDGLDPNGAPNHGLGNVTFFWTFEGGDCAQASVQTVVVTMPGQTLQDQGSYPCSTNGEEGITLQSFAPGDYPYVIDGYDSSGNLLYEMTGDVFVDGRDVVESVDLASVGGHTTPPGGIQIDGGMVDGDGGIIDADGGVDPADAGVDPNDGGVAQTDGGQSDGGTTHPRPDGGSGANAYLSWSFPQSANAPVCGGEITQVVATIDGVATTYDCTAGLAPAEVATPLLPLGTHTIQLDAVDASGTVWATTQGSLDVSCSCTTTPQSFQLPWIVGSAAIDWLFFDSAHQNPTTSCDTTQVETMAVNFEDAAGHWLYADAQNNPTDDMFSCADSGGMAVYRALPPGTYTVFLAGYGANSCVTYSVYPDADCYQLTVSAGVFFTRDSPASSFVGIDLDQQ